MSQSYSNTGYHANCGAAHDKIFCDKECYCDVLADGSVVQFQRITSYNHTRKRLEIDDRTEDLLSGYTVQGTASRCCDLGEDAHLLTLPFCNDGVTFYRTIDVISNLIIRSFDGDMQEYNPIGNVTSGACPLSIDINDVDGDCDDCGSATPEGVVTEW